MNIRETAPRITELEKISTRTDTRDYLAKAAATKEKHKDWLIVDVDAHVTETAFMSEINSRIDNEVLRYISEAFQERGESLQLVLVEPLRQQGAHARDVGLFCFLQLSSALRREDRVRDARVFLARAVADIAGLLEAFQEAGDPGGRQQDAFDKVDPPQRPLRRARDLGQHVEVVDRQPVHGQQLGVELPRDGRVSAQEVDPRRELYASQIRYLTSQPFSCTLLECSTIERTNISI